jgi:hypothetical protein
MFFQIRNVPDYREGESYVSFSPDGKYRLDHIYTTDGKDSVRIFSSQKDNNIIAIVPTPFWFEVSINPLWICNDDKSECYEHILQTHDGVPVDFPPSWWSHLHAWLTIKFKHLEKPQLNIVEIDESYPPVTKK